MSGSTAEGRVEREVRRLAYRRPSFSGSGVACASVLGLVSVPADRLAFTIVVVVAVNAWGVVCLAGLSRRERWPGYADICVVAGVPAVDYLLFGLWMPIFCRAVVEPVPAGSCRGPEADRISASRERRRRTAEIDAARRADEREHLAALRDGAERRAGVIAVEVADDGRGCW